MSFHNMQNNFSTTLLGDITSASKTTITLTTIPTILPPYYLTIGNDLLTNPSQCEIVEVISNSSGTLTINRAQQGTIAQLFPSGTKVQMIITSSHFDEIHNDLNSITTELLESTGYGIISGLTTIAQATPTMAVNVASGVVHMPDETRFTPIANSALLISNADATNPRIDIVYVNNTGVISYLAGIPAATPIVPLTPTGGFLLSQVSVSTNATSITNANITDKRKIKNTTDTNANQIAVLSGTSGLAEKANKSNFDLHVADITNKTATHHRLNVVDSFGADNTGVNDSTSALQAARDYIASQAQPSTLVFPAGIYKYSVSPNWAIQDAQIIADGEVRLRYTGTGNAVILDGSIGTNSNVYHMKFGKFIIEAPSTALDGVYMTSVHHSEINVKVLGAGSSKAGFHLLFGVCNIIHLTVSVNEEGWYSRPVYGLQLGQLISGQAPSYNLFLNCIIEGTQEGAYIDYSLGNIFMGGTMEGCLDSGLWMTVNAGLNKTFGMDFESNPTNDIYCLGFQNEFHTIDSTKMVDFGTTAKNNRVRGGSVKSATFESGSTGNLFDGVCYNRQLNDGTTGVITDNGTSNRIINCFDVKNNVWHA